MSKCIGVVVCYCISEQIRLESFHYFHQTHNNVLSSKKTKLNYTHIHTHGVMVRNTSKMLLYTIIVNDDFVISLPRAN